jgi:hypothetical protein
MIIYFQVIVVDEPVIAGDTKAFPGDVSIISMNGRVLAGNHYPISTD